MPRIRLTKAEINKAFGDALAGTTTGKPALTNLRAKLQEWLAKKRGLGTPGAEG